MAEVDFDMRDVEAGFRGMSSRARRLSPALRPFVRELRAELKQHFERMEGPDGRWPSWARSTQEKFLAQRSKSRLIGPLTLEQTRRRARLRKNVTVKGHLKKSAARRMNRVLGRLPMAMAFTLGPDYIEARNLARWSAVHDEGGRAGRGADEPRRQFMWASESLLARFKDRLLDHILGGWNG